MREAQAVAHGYDQVPEMDDKCRWIGKDSHEFGDNAICTLDRDCAEFPMLEDAMILEYAFLYNYCPYCGRKIEVFSDDTF